MIREHPSKVVKLVEGELVGYPPTADEDCTLWFTLGDGADFSENLIAISVEAPNSQAVATYLAAREPRGDLKYETGRTR